MLVFLKCEQWEQIHSKLEKLYLAHMVHNFQYQFKRKLPHLTQLLFFFPPPCSWFRSGLEIRENLGKWEGILQSGKSQGIFQDWKSQGILLKILEKLEKVILEN